MREGVRHARERDAQAQGGESDDERLGDEGDEEREVSDPDAPSGETTWPKRSTRGRAQRFGMKYNTPKRRSTWASGYIDSEPK